MHDAPPILIALEKLVIHWLHVVGNGIEVFGVLVIVIGTSRKSNSGLIVLPGVYTAAHRYLILALAAKYRWPGER
jgi:hypothetical protein